jgi:hypothetical protein
VSRSVEGYDSSCGHCSRFGFVSAESAVDVLSQNGGRHMTTIFLGSYNGQDSLGDECLLRAVIERVRNQRSDEPIIFQMDPEVTAFAGQLAIESDVRIQRSVNACALRVAHICNRLGLGDAFGKRLAWMLMPVWLRLGVATGREVASSLRRTDRLVIFGGTQFSGQWFDLNAPAYFYSILEVRRAGGRAYLGPQQYGPLRKEQAALLSKRIRLDIADWRTRNIEDVVLLGKGAPDAEGRLVYDEVFSQVRLYPDLDRTPVSSHILVNLRATTFDTNATIEAGRYSHIAGLVDRLSEHYALPVIFFGVSDATFSEDEAAFEVIRKLSAAPERLSSVGRLRDEHHLFELAQGARLALSMSFHGCILAGIAGAPFIPVTEGDYYDYKYADFDKYTGGQGVPIVGLRTCDPVGDADRIVRFVEKYDRTQTREARRRASDLTDVFYSGMFARLPSGARS